MVATRFPIYGRNAQQRVTDTLFVTGCFSPQQLLFPTLIDSADRKGMHTPNIHAVVLNLRIERETLTHTHLR